MSSIEEKVKRFDDVFKLSLTLLTISMAFGLNFFKNLGPAFFLSIAVAFASALFFWAVGHLYSGQWGIFLKLMSWWFFSHVTPAIFLNYIIEKASEETHPPYSGVPVLVIGFFIYFPIYRYLKNGVDKSFARILLYFPILMLISLSAWSTLGSIFFP